MESTSLEIWQIMVHLVVWFLLPTLSNISKVKPIKYLNHWSYQATQRMSKFTKEKERNHIYTQECGFWEAACKTDQLKGNKSFFFFTFPGNGYETLAPGDIWIKKRNTHVWEKSNYLHISNPI